MADVQKTYGLVALGFVLALLTGVFLWFPITALTVAHIGTGGAVLLAILAFIPLFIAIYRPAMWSYLLFAAVTEGYVLSVIPIYAAYLGAVVAGVVLGAAIAFAAVGLFFNQRSVDARVGSAAFWAILLSLFGSITLLIGGLLGWYSWHLDLGAAIVGLIGFALFAVYDASRVRYYDNEYRAAVQLLIDLVGIVVELLRILLLLQRRD